MARLTPEERCLKSRWEKAAFESALTNDLIRELGLPGKLLVHGNEVFRRALALALDLDPESDETQAFVLEIWFALDADRNRRNISDVPPPPRLGLTIRRALRVGLTLQRLCIRTVGNGKHRVLKVPAAVAQVDKAQLAKMARAEAQPEKNAETYSAYEAQRGRRGAVRHAADCTEGRDGSMTPQGAGKRIQAHAATLEDPDQTTMRARLSERIRTRRRHQHVEQLLDQLHRTSTE